MLLLVWSEVQYVQSAMQFHRWVSACWLNKFDEQDDNDSLFERGVYETGVFETGVFETESGVLESCVEEQNDEVHSIHGELSD